MNAGHKWIQLLFDVLDYEFDDGPLLSEGADTIVEKYPVAGRMFIYAVGAVITLHLSNSLPSRFDLLSQDFWRDIKGR